MDRGLRKRVTMLLLKIVLWTLGSLIGLIVAYLVFVCLGVLISTAMAPREDMFICDRNPAHGAFLKKHCLEFMGTLYCPVCFHEKSKQAESLLK